MKIDKYTPDPVTLVETVIEKKPELLFHLQHNKISVVNLILNNKNVSDEIALEMLQMFVGKGYNFKADPMFQDINSFQMLCFDTNVLKNNLKSFQYIESALDFKLFKRIEGVKDIKDMLLGKTEFNEEALSKFLSNMPINLLDRPMLTEGQSIGHLCLQHDNISCFEQWLNRGAACIALAYNNKIKSYDSILTLLCIKGLDRVPNLFELIKRVLEINPNLLFMTEETAGVHPAATLILTNKHIDDRFTVEVLKEFNSRGYNFLADAFMAEKYHNNSFNHLENTKPETIKYLKNEMSKD